MDEGLFFVLFDLIVVKERRNSKDFRSVDEIFKLVSEKVGKIGGLVEGLEFLKDVIIFEFFNYQKEGFGWLFWRENFSELFFFWEEKDGMYVNVLINYQINIRLEFIRGGIFVDDMGLGKMLILLFFIVYDRKCCGNGNKREAIENDGDIINYFGGKKGKRERKGRRVSISISRKKRKFDSSDVDFGVNENMGFLDSKSILVVCLFFVFFIWIFQLCEYIQCGFLKLYMYYGGERIWSVEEFKKYDIVFIIYSILLIEEF